MNRTRWTVWIVTCLVFVGAIMVLAAQPSYSALCNADTDTKGGPVLYGDEEMNTHGRLYIRIHSADCGTSDKITFGKGYFGPNKDKNKRMYCGGQARGVWVNPSPIAGYDPPRFWIKCTPDGKWVNFHIPDKMYKAGKGDRSFSATFRVDRPAIGDWIFRTSTGYVR